MNDERRLAVVEGDSRAGDGLDITVTSYRGQSEGEYASMDPAMQRKEKKGKQREGGGSKVEARRLYKELGGVLYCSKSRRTGRRIHLYLDTGGYG